VNCVRIGCLSSSVAGKAESRLELLDSWMVGADELRDALGEKNGLLAKLLAQIFSMISELISIRPSP
jgi:hypothetical protein